MADETRGRRAIITILYEGANISEDISKDLISFTATSNIEEGEANNLEIQLDNREQLWTGSWYPMVRTETATQVQKPVTPNLSTVTGFEDITGGGAGTTETVTQTHVSPGSRMVVNIIVQDWTDDGSTQTLPLGTYEVDDARRKGPPDTFTIKGISVPTNSRLRNQANTQAWEDKRLSDIAGVLTVRAGLNLLYDADIDPRYDRIEQIEKPDVAFLYELCTEAGLSMTVTGTEVAIFNPAVYEQKPAVRKIVYGESYILDYDIGFKRNDQYGSATVTYHDPRSGQTISQTFTPETSNKGLPELIINVRPPSVPRPRNPGRIGQSIPRSTTPDPDDFGDIMNAQSASTMQHQAKAALREKNKDEGNVVLVLVGDPNLVAGVTVELEGWQRDDGKYIITKDVQTINASGYTTTIHCRGILEGY